MVDPNRDKATEQDMGAVDSLRSQKKTQDKDHLAILQQFDKIATAFQRNQGQDSVVKVKAAERSTEMVPETAGMLKKKGKKKKEKSLSAKLRLKEKKSPGKK
jgi:hypothetical protein